MSQLDGVARDKAFRLSALALASGASALWGGAAQATLITQTYNLPLSDSLYTIQIAGGSPFGHLSTQST